MFTFLINWKVLRLADVKVCKRKSIQIKTAVKLIEKLRSRAVTLRSTYTLYVNVTYAAYVWVEETQESGCDVSQEAVEVT